MTDEKLEDVGATGLVLTLLVIVVLIPITIWVWKLIMVKLLLTGLWLAGIFAGMIALSKK